ncbi:TetR/AcrR family transcriptional regulator [Kribbella sp. NPDC050124]|uniref:TetR/AcrR family transcriptional regulator n=1 Tax=Kribbella sp. NPDC050124 TaxID=3364114 RepID=UPI0037A5F0E4
MATEQVRRRADAERNAETIIVVTRDLLAAGIVPAMKEVAGAAQVTRATLYSHFPTREALLEAVVLKAISETDEALSALELESGDVDEALVRLVRRSWPMLDRSRKVRAAALRHLGAEALRSHHDAAFRHVEQLITRGRRTGVYRSDLSLDWLVATFYAVLHAAADEVEAGRLASDAAPEALIASLRSLLRSEQRDAPG